MIMEESKSGLLNKDEETEEDVGMRLIMLLH